MMLTMFICYAPLSVIAVERAAFHSLPTIFYENAVTVMILIGILNNFINPVIFGWKDKAIKNFIVKVLHCR